MLKTTVEKCPVCENPEMKVEHGCKDDHGCYIHVEDCPDCGKSYPAVGYACPDCPEEQRVFIKGIEDKACASAPVPQGKGEGSGKD